VWGRAVILRDRVGVLLPTAGVPLSDVLALAETADRIGCATVAAGELNTWDATGALAYLAATTSAVRLAASVLPLPTRSVTQLAVAASTLAELSGGRFELGLGVGGDVVAKWHGCASAPSTAQLARTIARVRGLLDGERDTATGFRLNRVARHPVPVLVGALGPRTQAAAFVAADGVVVSLRGPDDIAELRRRAGTARVVAIQWVAPAADPDTARDALATAALPYLALPGYDLVLEPDERAAVRAAVASRQGDARRLLPARVVDRIGMGTAPGELETRIEAMVDAGADEVRLMPVEGAVPALANALERIGQ
jgi:alkanesulfonate monooxygenase SsuD/methylene tetrahydromethanopterin reductase-like flavin-dependent oxidoreductase (luciferase family)